MAGPMKWTMHVEDGLVTVAPGISAKARVFLEIEDVEGYDVVIEVRAQPASDGLTGRFYAHSVTATQRPGSAPVSSESLRRVPVGRLLKDGATKYAQNWVFSTYDEDGESPGHPAEFTPDRLHHYRESGPTPETLKRVAFVYRYALVLGDAPTNWVQDTFGIPRSTAGRWVALARDKGFLGAAEGAGKAGG